MTFFKTYLRWLATPLAAIVFVASCGVRVAHAGIVTTDQAAHQQAVAVDRDQLLAALDRQDVRDQLEALGVSPQEAAKRINALSDQQLAEVADHVDHMPAGQGFIGFVIGVALITLIVLVVTDALDVTDVF
jgi:hypothetical protein